MPTFLDQSWFPPTTRSQSLPYAIHHCGVAIFCQALRCRGLGGGSVSAAASKVVRMA
jgi:hypothetical protein